MKKTKNNMIIIAVILSFTGSFIGSAQARTYHFVGGIPGLMNSPVADPFSEDTTYTKNVSISAISDIPGVQEHEDVSITLNTNNSTDLDTVGMSYELSNNNTIENISFSGTGSSRTLSFDRISSANVGDVVAVKTKASINGVQEDSKTFSVTLGDAANVEMVELADISIVQQQTQASMTIELTTTTGEDLNDVTFDYELTNNDVIENVIFTGTGSTRTMTFDRVYSTSIGDTVDVTVKSLLGGTEKDIETFSIETIGGFVCNSSNPLTNMETDNGVYLIGGTERNSFIAKQQLLCMNHHQTSGVLSSSYKMTADVKFDINFSVNKSGSSYFTLSASVSSNNEDWNGDGSIDETGTAGWDPIGGNFTGSFDGNGHTISNLYIKNPAGYTHVGMFRYVNSGAVIKNLGLKNAFVYSHVGQVAHYVGALVGRNYGTVQNCYVKGNVYSSNIGKSYAQDHGGGIIGMNNGTIRRCYAEGNVVSVTNYDQAIAGGIAGRNYGTLQDCHTSSEVSANYVSSKQGFAGGVVGMNNGNLRYSYSTGNVFFRSGLIGGVSSYGGATSSYAINNRTAMGDRGPNNSNYCTVGIDAGCSATAINSGWNSSIWSSLGTNTPTLKNMPN